MRGILWVIVGIDLCWMALLCALTFKQFEVSEFVFRERVSHRADEQTKLHRQLYLKLNEVRLLKSVILIISGSIVIVMLSHLLQPALGTTIGLVLTLVAVVIARLKFIQKSASNIFERYLNVVLSVVKKLHPLWALLGVPTRSNYIATIPNSPAELTDQLKRLPDAVLGSIPRQRLVTVLQSSQKTVASIMTPKKRVVSVTPSAVVGPVVLSDLQKTGHGYFPVVAKNAEPEGLLMLADLSDIHQAKQRATVSDLLSPQVAWVEEETSLDELTQAFLEEKQYLLFVRNVEGQYSGIVTIADLMKHLVGIVKE